MNRVDDREFRRALLALLEEALRLVEEARVFQRHAHARRDRGKQPHLGLAEGVLALVVLENDRSSTRSLPTMGTKTEDSLMSVPGMAPIPAASDAARLLWTTGWRVATIFDQGPSCMGLPGATFSLVPCSYS